jgi:predicted transcriptional regulator
MENDTLAEAILKYVLDRQMSHQLDIRDEFVVKGNYQSMEVLVKIDELLERKFLVLMQARKNTVRITEKGKKALQLGLKGYNEFVAEIKAEERRKSMIREIAIGLLCTLLGGIIPSLLGLIQSIL